MGRGKNSKGKEPVAPKPEDGETVKGEGNKPEEVDSAANPDTTGTKGVADDTKEEPVRVLGKDGKVLRTYTKAQHGPHYKTLAKAYAKSMKGEVK